MGFSRQQYWSGVPLPSPKSELGEIIKVAGGGFYVYVRDSGRQCVYLRWMASGSLADEGTFTLKSEGGDVTNQVKIRDKRVARQTLGRAWCFLQTQRAPLWLGVQGRLIWFELWRVVKDLRIVLGMFCLYITAKWTTSKLRELKQQLPFVFLMNLLLRRAGRERVVAVPYGVIFHSWTGKWGVYIIH